ncbi:hypothetical protein Rhal01_02013 [Rubritalea halochordaticola]|uniref:DUF4288 domain-containing protein n=1 Tax=Rubritalea halochordaticola TaxID=714537 RepID=A0ABP9V1Q5_9BACT
MASYTVRMVVLWPSREDQKLKYLYEERITMWQAESMDEAIELAEEEAKEYAESEGFELLDLFQAYWMFNEPLTVEQGMEVFSLLRESDLEASVYLDTFFDTHHERQGVYEDKEDSEV